MSAKEIRTPSTHGNSWLLIYTIVLVGCQNQEVIWIYGFEIHWGSVVCFKMFQGWSSSHNSTVMDFFNACFEKFIMLVRQLQNDLPAPSDFGWHKVLPEAQESAPILSSVFVFPMQEVFHWPHCMTFSSVSNMKYPVPYQWLKLWQSRLLPWNFVLE